MSTYIILNQWTQQGLQTIKDAPARLDAARQAAKVMGGEIKAFYLVMGQYDFVVIAEAPNDETIAKLLLGVGAQGNFRTQTLKAFSEDEYRKMVSSMP